MGKRRHILSYLRIYISSWHDETSLCPWALCSDTGEILDSGASSLAQMPKAKNCLTIIAAEHVLATHIPRPPGKPRQWRNALPFLVEEYLLADPESVHVVPSPSTEKERVGVAVVDKAWLRRLVNACTAAHINLRKIVPESLLPECASDQWVLVWNGQQGFLKTSAWTSFAVDSDDSGQPPVMLALTLSQAATVPKAIQLRTTDDLSGKFHWDVSVPLLNGEPWDWRNADIPASAPNLLWGEFAPPVRFFDWLPKLRPLAMILALTLSIEILGANIYWAKLAVERHSLKSEIEQTFRNAIGNQASLVNPTMQMQRQLSLSRHKAGLPDTADFIPMLDSIAAILGKSGVRTLALNYDSGRIDLEISAPEKMAISGIQEQLRAAGFLVTSNNANTANNLQIKLALSLNGPR